MPIVGSIGSTGCHIKPSIDDLGDRLYLRPELLFNFIQIKPVFICYQVDRKTEMTEPSRTANTMQICFAIFREIEVDNDIHSLDIDTTREKVRANEITRDTITEVVKNTITMGLKHFSMRIEARVAELGDLFG